MHLKDLLLNLSSTSPLLTRVNPLSPTAYGRGPASGSFFGVPMQLALVPVRVEEAAPSQAAREMTRRDSLSFRSWAPEKG